MPHGFVAFSSDTLSSDTISSDTLCSDAISSDTISSDSISSVAFRFVAHCKVRVEVRDNQGVGVHLCLLLFEDVKIVVWDFCVVVKTA